MEKFDDDHVSSVTPNDVYWEYQGDKHFEPEVALAVLLLNEVVFLNSHWWKYERMAGWDKEKKCAIMEVDPEARWTKEESELISVNVNCNDVFAWGCSDAEELRHDEIQDLYDHWLKDYHWGPAVWCIKKRKMMPQAPVEHLIKKQGIWDLDAMNLEANPTN